MRVLLLGVRGMLGADVAHALSANGDELISVDKAELDIRNLDGVLGLVDRCRPDALINCTGYTNVDGCEDEAAQAYAVNSIGPRNLAAACEKHGSKLLHIGTDYVFDGESGHAYTEDDPCNPISVYGKSKLAGENNIRALLNRHFIVRTQWIYGKNGKNFVETMLGAAAVGRKLRVVSDQFGSPTATRDLSDAIMALVRTDAYGTYHITNTGVVSWYRFALDIFEAAGVCADIEPCSTDEYPRPARRPKYSPLKNLNWELSGFKPLRDYREALKEYIKGRV